MSSPYDDLVIADGPTHYWPLDETGGTKHYPFGGLSSPFFDGTGLVAWVEDPLDLTVVAHDASVHTTHAVGADVATFTAVAHDASIVAERTVVADHSTFSIDAHDASVAAARIVVPDHLAITALPHDALVQAEHTVVAGFADLSFDTIAAVYVGNVVLLPPTRTVSGEGWRGSDGGSNLHTYLDDPDALTYAVTSDDPEDESFEVGLQPLQGEVEADEAHVLTYAISREGPEDVTLIVRLMEGEVEVASWVHQSATLDEEIIEQALTPAQAASITDYTDLRVQVTAMAGA